MTSVVETDPRAGVRLGTAAGRRLLAATVLGSALVSLDATVVTVAVPRIGASLDVAMVGAQWVMSAYMVALASLIPVGGALGDRYGRRAVLLWGTVGFALASLWCGLAGTIESLVAARVAQGVAGALVTPGSLALLSAAIDPRDRGRAIGLWAGFGGVAGALGPVAGGWLVESAGWRAAFLVNVPLAIVVVIVAARISERREPRVGGRPDLLSSALFVASLAVTSYGLIDARWWWALAGAVALVAVSVGQAHTRDPLIPPAPFRSRTFTAVNLATFPAYAALGCGLFLLVLQLQVSAGYPPAAAGAATIPVTALMLVMSGWSGGYAQRHGARAPMTIGSITAGLGTALLSGVGAHAPYPSAVLPGVTLLGVGLGILVTPLTAAVFAAVRTEDSGLASGVNNAVARAGQLLGIAAIPSVVGISRTSLTAAGGLDGGYRAGMWICGGLFVLAAALSAFLLPRAVTTRDAGARPRTAGPRYVYRGPRMLSRRSEPAPSLPPG
ncbi:MFS transporter [Nocardia spumae]|uniref:MFS transporter n=1 Tax=Nocardia spumae TaxID=2887190 RepID=UPI001D14A1B7|nr:MFS transporter [Nocardia spumae]